MTPRSCELRLAFPSVSDDVDQAGRRLVGLQPGLDCIGIVEPDLDIADKCVLAIRDVFEPAGYAQREVGIDQIGVVDEKQPGRLLQYRVRRRLGRKAFADGAQEHARRDVSDLHLDLELLFGRIGSILAGSVPSREIVASVVSVVRSLVLMLMSLKSNFRISVYSASRRLNSIAKVLPLPLGSLGPSRGSRPVVPES